MTWPVNASRIRLRTSLAEKGQIENEADNTIKFDAVCASVYSGRLEIHSTHPGALMHYSVQSPEGNPDSSPPVQSPVHAHRTPVRDLAKFIL